MEIALPKGGAVVFNGPAPSHLGLRRFAGDLAADLGTLAAGRAAILRIPPDDVDRRWRLGASGGSQLRICRLPTRPGIPAGS
jgi:hypothetical protein